MFFGDPVAAFAHMRRAANTGARMAFVCWRQLDENPWMQVPMNAVARHLPPRPKPVPNAPGMFAFTDPQRVFEILTEAGSAPSAARQTRPRSGHRRRPRAGRGCGSVDPDWRRNSWLRNQPAEVVLAAIASLREALAAHLDGASVRCRVRSGWSAARLSERAPPLTNFVQCMVNLRPVHRDDPPPSCPMLEV